MFPCDPHEIIKETKVFSGGSKGNIEKIRVKKEPVEISVTESFITVSWKKAQ